MLTGASQNNTVKLRDVNQELLRTAELGASAQRNICSWPGDDGVSDVAGVAAWDSYFR